MEVENARAKNTRAVEKEILDRVMRRYSGDFRFETTDMVRTRRTLTAIQNAQLDILVRARRGKRSKRTPEMKDAECRLYASTRLLTDLHQRFSGVIVYED